MLGRLGGRSLPRDEAGVIKFRVMPDEEAAAIIEQVKKQEAAKGDE